MAQEKPRSGAWLSIVAFPAVLALGGACGGGAPTDAVEAKTASLSQVQRPPKWARGICHFTGRSQTLYDYFDVWSGRDVAGHEGHREDFFTNQRWCPLCGDHRVERGETCDPPESCPASCDDHDACTRDIRDGAARTCDVHCRHVPLVTCVSGDGCCPAGCDAGQDSDCATSCGNGRLDPGETCDPPSACPASCDDGDVCTRDQAIGSATTCDLACQHTAITACTSNDGCCPPGCGASSDSDCKPICGNGVIEPGETCDPPSSCPTSCDDGYACSVDVLVGNSSTCTAACSTAYITACQLTADGCCPSTCNANTDADCSPYCGNYVIEAGETCDPPASCPTICDDGDSCTADTISGSSASCTAVCGHVPVTTCGLADGCCPSGCDVDSDPDCGGTCPAGAPPPRAKAIAVGTSSACALMEDGTVQCWGDNAAGQLGNGATVARSYPVKVVGVSGVTSLSSAGMHTCALAGSGSVYCWGYNGKGQLGDGTHTNRSLPVQVKDLPPARAVFAGLTVTCAVLVDGTARCWGANGNGELGGGDTVASGSPVEVLGISDPSVIVSGTGYTCALLAGGTVKCWGWNAHGNLGNGTTSDSLTPVVVSNVSHAVGVTSGGEFSCVVSDDGTVRCWGYAQMSQLGDQRAFSASTPLLVNVSRALAVQAAPTHACALLSGGWVACWGGDARGELGDGKTTDSSWPVRGKDIEGAQAVAVGGEFSCALAHDGLVRCWGRNDLGQLGDGSTVDRASPVAVALRSDCPVSCTGGCDDENPCTIDSCVPGLGCEHRPDGSLCWDQEPCTSDACVAVSAVGFMCQHTLASDGSSCQPETAPGTAAYCSTPGLCQAGACQGSSVLTCATWECHQPGVCNPSNGMCDWTWTNGDRCSVSPCYQDGICQTGFCHNGTLRPIVCPIDPLDKCHDIRTLGVCDTQRRCWEPAARPDGASCDNDNVCDGTETCQSGQCVPGSPPPDGSPCAGGVCSSLLCTPPA